jgi:hypothetical protein
MTKAVKNNSSSLMNDLIFYKEGDQIKSVGYSINSILLQNGMSPMKTFNTSKQIGGDNISSDFEELAVPSGLSYISQKKSSSELFSGGSLKPNPTDQRDVLSDDIYDKLFGLVEYDKKQKRKTRKHTSGIDAVPISGSLTNGKKSKKTRKNNT